MHRHTVHIREVRESEPLVSYRKLDQAVFVS